MTVGILVLIILISWFGLALIITAIRNQWWYGIDFYEYWAAFAGIFVVMLVVGLAIMLIGLWIENWNTPL